MPAYDHPQETGRLFTEYTDMLIIGDSTFRKYLDYLGLKGSVFGGNEGYACPECKCPSSPAAIEKYVTIHTGYKGLEVTKEGILCEDKDGVKVLVPGNSVICALGQRSRTDAVEEFRDEAPFVRVIGDAAKVSTITNAVYLRYHAALDI